MKQEIGFFGIAQRVQEFDFRNLSGRFFLRFLRCFGSSSNSRIFSHQPSVQKTKKRIKSLFQEVKLPAFPAAAHQLNLKAMLVLLQLSCIPAATYCWWFHQLVEVSDLSFADSEIVVSIADAI